MYAMIKYLINIINEIFFHIEIYTEEYEIFVYRVTRKLPYIIVILLILLVITVNLVKVNYRYRSFLSRNQHLVLLGFKLIIACQQLVIILGYIFLITCFFFVLILFLKLLFKIFYIPNLKYDRKNLETILNFATSSGPDVNYPSPGLNLLIAELWSLLMDFIVIAIHCSLYSAFLNYGTVFIDSDFANITNGLMIIFFSFLCIFNSIANIFFHKNLFKNLFNILYATARLISLILFLIALFLLCYLNGYTKQILFILVCISIITIILYYLGNLFKIIKRSKENLFLFFRILKILFGILLATINIGILLATIYIFINFYFVTKIKPYYPNITFTDIPYDYIYIIFVFLTILISILWLGLKEEEFFSRINCMVNVLCFLSQCLAFFCAVFIIIGLCISIQQNLIDFFSVIYDLPWKGSRFMLRWIIRRRK